MLSLLQLCYVDGKNSAHFTEGLAALKSVENRSSKVGCAREARYVGIQLHFKVNANGRQGDIAIQIC
jgi:hypothetical protein